MIDAVWVPTSVHFVAGAVVVATAALAVIVSAIYAFRRRPLSRWAHGVLIVAQLSLAIQVLIGIKLLDQGLGPMQLFVHYLGGLGALLFYLVYYWAPEAFRSWRWAPQVVTGMAFLFVLMAFGIGSTYEASVADAGWFNG